MFKKLQNWMVDTWPMGTLVLLRIGTWPYPEITIFEVETEGFIGALFHVHTDGNNFTYDFLFLVSISRYMWWWRRRKRRLG